VVPDTTTCNSLIDGLCKFGRISCVWVLIDEMGDRNQQPNVITYNILLDALFKNHRLDKAIELFSKMMSNMYTSMILIDGMCKVGRIKNVQETF